MKYIIFVFFLISCAPPQNGAVEVEQKGRGKSDNLSIPTAATVDTPPKSTAETASNIPLENTPEPSQQERTQPSNVEVEPPTRNIDNDIEEEDALCLSLADTSQTKLNKSDYDNYFSKNFSTQETDQEIKSNNFSTFDADEKKIIEVSKQGIGYKIRFVNLPNIESGLISVVWANRTKAQVFKAFYQNTTTLETEQIFYFPSFPVIEIFVYDLSSSNNNNYKTLINSTYDLSE